MVEALVKDLGPSRVLFGSDILGRSQASQIAKVLFENIPERAKRQIFHGNALAVFGPAVAPGPPLPTPPLRPPSRLPELRADHFCFCGRWPFFETGCQTPMELGVLLAEHGVAKAYVGDLGGVYRLDLEQANAGFLRAARKAPRVAAIATLSPMPNNWRQAIRHLPRGVAGAVVHPYLHNWALDDPAHAEFFRRCAEGQIPLWINCRFGDNRFQHSGLACRAVSAEELVRFGKIAPANSYVFQGLTACEICRFLDEVPWQGRFRFEISRLTDHPGALDQVVAAHGLSSLVMGSEFPLRDLRAIRFAAERQ